MSERADTERRRKKDISREIEVVKDAFRDEARRAKRHMREDLLAIYNEYAQA